MFPNPDNLSFLEDLYQAWRRDPASVGPEWRPFFADMGMDGSEGTYQPQAHTPRSIFSPTTSTAIQGMDLREASRIAQVWRLVNAYRVRGHLMADVDPLQRQPILLHPDLDPLTYGFTPSEMGHTVPSGGLFGMDEARLEEILSRLRETYCRTIGVEFMHISDPGMKRWLQERMETTRNRRSLDRDTQVHRLRKLLQAEGLEQFLHTKFVGSKRFSLEGAEGTITFLDALLEECGQLGVLEVVVGMAHRGRLNILHTILNKSAKQLFSEFEDVDPMATLGSGDVKYHLGFSSDYSTRGGARIHLSLTANPSHLEAVDPVVVGRVRAKQDREAARLDRKGCLGLLIHGDAAFAGQGLVAETLNLADLEGYATGGTVHVVINNHIGFTTSPRSSRSTPYCTDVAKMMQCPIFHVNGEDVEAMAQVAWLAAEFRHTFQKDVVIDINCYRRYGHNELDEPSFTQPLMYKAIQSHPSPAETYQRQLLAAGRVSQSEVDAIYGELRASMEEALAEVRGGSPLKKKDLRSPPTPWWKSYRGGRDADVPQVDTGVAAERLEFITSRLMELPPGFSPHPKTLSLMKKRQEMGRGEVTLDWGMAELLAYGSLLLEGHPVRITGQDCRRGTFSHRHAARTDIKTGEEYIPLCHLDPSQARLSIYDSSLSEAGVLGFEWGYSLDYPDGLVIWEAQFGDFANGAQVIIDQFISSSEDKWGRLSGLVMLLPHGYEGQGPEHSSARLERYLQLCGDDNIQVVNATTPANIFHLLRRQVCRPIRKPLVVMSPKSLLRDPRAVSERSSLVNGRFQRVIVEGPQEAAAATRIILCTGKIAYDIRDIRDQLERRGDVLVRVEQLYPLPQEELLGVLSTYPNVQELVWVQEEPEQMGAWYYMYMNTRSLFGHLPMTVCARPASASPATGSHKAHLIEARMLMEAVFSKEAIEVIHNYYRVEY